MQTLFILLSSLQKIKDFNRNSSLNTAREVLRINTPVAKAMGSRENEPVVDQSPAAEPLSLVVDLLTNQRLEKIVTIAVDFLGYRSRIFVETLYHKNLSKPTTEETTHCSKR
jgi:hypothetical protein